MVDDFKKTMFDPTPPKAVQTGRYRLRRTRPYLLIISGASSGREFPVQKEPFIIGRDPKSALPIDDALASRRHASIYFKDGRYRVKDLGSTNGTMLNGKRVSDSILSEKDRIQVGNTVLQFFLGELEL